MREQVTRMDAETYVKTLAALMKENPPACEAEDAPMVAGMAWIGMVEIRMAKIGIVPGGNFDMSKPDPAVARGGAGQYC